MGDLELNSKHDHSIQMHGLRFFVPCRGFYGREIREVSEVPGGAQGSGGDSAVQETQEASLDGSVERLLDSRSAGHSEGAGGRLCTPSSIFRRRSESTERASGPQRSRDFDRDRGKGHRILGRYRNRCPRNPKPRRLHTHGHGRWVRPGSAVGLPASDQPLAFSAKLRLAIDRPNATAQQSKSKAAAGPLALTRSYPARPSAPKQQARMHHGVATVFTDISRTFCAFVFSRPRFSGHRSTPFSAETLRTHGKRPKGVHLELI